MTVEAMTARKAALSRSLAALTCMRRSGETRAALARRDETVARLEAEHAALAVLLADATGSEQADDVPGESDPGPNERTDP